MSKRNPSVIDFGLAVRGGTQEGMRTCVPSTVLDYSTADQTITAQPSANYGDEPHAKVYDVPVLFPSGGGWSISWGLNPGDPVHLLVADRALEGFRSGGGQPYTPADKRRHNISDAEALPASGPTPNPITGLTSNFVIRGPTGIHFEIDSTIGDILINGTNVIQLGDGATNPAGLIALAQGLHTYLVQIFTAAATATMDGGATFKANILAQLGANPYTAFATTKTIAQ